MTHPTVLETSRLILRRLVMEDLDDLFALYSDPEVRKYFPEGTLSYEQTKEELENNWIIPLKESWLKNRLRLKIES